MSGAEGLIIMSLGSPVSFILLVSVDPVFRPVRSKYQNGIALSRSFAVDYCSRMKVYDTEKITPPLLAQASTGVLTAVMCHKRDACAKGGSGLV